MQFSPFHTCFLHFFCFVRFRFWWFDSLSQREHALSECAEKRNPVCFPNVTLDKMLFSFSPSVTAQSLNAWTCISHISLSNRGCFLISPRISIQFISLFLYFSRGDKSPDLKESYNNPLTSAVLRLTEIKTKPFYFYFCTCSGWGGLIVGWSASALSDQTAALK